MRRKFALLALAAAAVITSSLADQNDDFFSKKTFIKSRDGWMRLGSADWTLKAESDQIIIATRFASKLRTGSILSLSARGAKGEIFQLRVRMDESVLSVDLLDSQGASILALPFADNSLNTTAGAAKEHSIGIRLKPSTGELVYSFENDKEFVARITKPLEIAGAELEVVLGSEDSSSLVGCITLVSLTLSSPLAQVNVLAEHDTQSCAVAGNECADRDCGDGVCRALETAHCDCFGTGKAGPNCRTSVPSARLSSSVDERLTYTPIPGDEQQIKRLALNFRLREDEDATRQGVLLSAALLSGKRLTVYVVNSKGSLQIDNELSVGFDLDDSLKDHSLALYIDGNAISLQADNKEEKKVEVNCQGDAKCLHFTDILYGSEPQTGQVTRIGMSGCIWETYADHYNILSMYYDGHPRVSSPHTLKRCNGDREEEEAFYAMQDHPASLSSQSLPQVQPDPELDGGPILPGSLLPPPLKKVSAPSPLPATPCNNAQGDGCRNGATCVVRNLVKECLCAHGFTGANCEFSAIPRTCAEARDFYRSPDGPTLIDVDGSGPLPKSVVDCKNGVTTIINDMPLGTVMHDTLEQHSQFILSYRDFTPQQVAMLVVESERCTQAVHYECVRAALGFEKAKTQFTVAGSNRTLTRIGKADKKCAGDRCHCEFDANGEDDGQFESPDVGVTQILAFRDHSIPNQNGQMSVGPLVCASHPGSAYPLRFTSPAAVLLSRPFERDLSIHFRTAASTGVILRTEGGLVLSLTSVYTISVTLPGFPTPFAVHSPVRLNNTAWHLVVLEILNAQLRLSIDNVMVVDHLTGDLPAMGAIQLGDATEGFIGCLRSLRLNNEVLNLHHETQQVETNEISLSCPDRCHSDLCKNDAECLDNLTDPSAAPVCVCKFPQIQQGANCEIDINKAPPVSFHGGHLKYEDLAASLTGEVVLSFRTDQQQGLILFSHDHLNNFLQVHLASEISVSLTLNNLDEVFTCTVEAEPGAEYSNMEWVQLVISHVDDSTILSVNGRLCFIRRARELSARLIKTYAHVETEIVKIPVGVQSSATLNPFLLTYLGGVKEITKKEGQLTLFARYDTIIPDFLGCVRGFRVGADVIDLTHTTKGTRPADPDLVQIGCDMGCASLACANGGHCGVAWANFHPELSRHAHCNCERTSYHGAQCRQDDSLSLTGGRSVHVDVKSYLDHYPLADKNHFQTLKIAFKSDSQPSMKQTLATIVFHDDSIFEVLLNRNGSVQIGWVKSDKTEVLTFAGNYSDGHRHFLVAQFKRDSATAILIDSSRHDMPWSPKNLDLFNAHSLTLGTPADARFVDAQRENFDGCLSNVQLDYQISAVKIEPIAELLNSSSTRWAVTTLHPAGASIADARLAACGAFKEKDHLPGLSHKVDFPVWDTNFGRLIYSGLWLEGGEQDSPFPWWIIILLILIIAVIVGIFLYIMCFKKSEPPKKTPEQVPLNPIQPVISTPIPNKPTSNFTIPEPDAVLPETGSGVEKDKSDEDEDWDRTVTEESIQRPDELGDLPSSTFNRSMPQRMSSFKRSDPTAPINSPLYVAPHEDHRLEERRVPKPVPPPRLSHNN